MKSIKSIVPVIANCGWKLELFEVDESIPYHYHHFQRHFIFATGGEMEILVGEQSHHVTAGDFLEIDVGISHAINPIGTASFLVLDVPGFEYPEDVHTEDPDGTYLWKPPVLRNNPIEKYFGKAIANPQYSAYPLVQGDGD